MTRKRRLALENRRRGRGVSITVRSPCLTLLFYVALLLLDHTGLIRVGLLCALLHEAGHVAVYLLLFRRAPRLELSIFGVCLSMRGVCLPVRAELALALAGPAVNALLALGALAGMRWGWGYSYRGCWFAATNLLVGGFNLLPLPGLDGARALGCLQNLARYKLQFREK